MIFNNFFFHNFTVNNIVDNAVTWKFHKGFVAYFNKITTKQQYKKRSILLVVNSSRYMP